MRVYRIWHWVAAAIGVIAVGLVYAIAFLPGEPEKRLSPESSFGRPPTLPDQDSTSSGAENAGPNVAATLPGALPPLPPRDSRFRNTGTDAAYVGSAACAQCHADQHDAYFRTPHSRAVAEVDDDSHLPDASVYHAASDQHFSVERRDGRMWHAGWFELPGGERYPLGEMPMHYRVGSGHFGHSYLAQDEGFLVQSPLTWYAPRANWGMSPGYDSPLHLGFRRLVSTGCLTCHAGQLETSDQNEFRARIHEHAISCERCHGPGSLHVQRHESSDEPRSGGAATEDAIDDTIVNPAHLSRELAENICQQCHLQGDVTVAVRGRRADEYRPGLTLADFRIDYRRPTADPQMTIVGHVEQLHASACYQQSPGLTCTTCHMPHHDQGASSAGEPSRSACHRCHSAESTTQCGLPLAKREEESGNDCLKCHMPSSPTEVPHVAFTHHRIGVFPIHETPRTGDAPRRLEPIPDLSRLAQGDRDRALGLASWKMFEKTGDSPEGREYFSQALQLVQTSFEAGFRDADVASLLAEHALHENDLETAAKLAYDVLKQSPHPTEPRVSALTVLAQIRFHQQRFEESRTFYREITRARRHASPYLYLGMCEQNCGNTTEAITALQQSLKIEPIQTGAHIALASIYQSQQKTELAELHRTRAKQVEEYWRRVHVPPE